MIVKHRLPVFVQQILHKIISEQSAVANRPLAVASRQSLDNEYQVHNSGLEAGD